jgi:hypothetical protein
LGVRVVIDIIDHSDQHYDTIGDYWMAKTHSWRGPDGPGTSEDTLMIVVSKLGDWKLEMLVAIHELTETLLMLSDGVPLESSTTFDVEFEKARAMTGNDNWFTFRGREYPANDEPGDSPDSPYRAQHNYATAVERMLCAAMGVDWAAYEDACAALEYTPK